MIPQIKICGLTRVDEAIECADLGADAIGLIFFEKSPRFVSDSQARKICDALPDTVIKVGVFVNKSFADIIKKVKACGLTGVQLHGQEASGLVERLVHENLLVIKGLFAVKRPNISEAPLFNASAYLVECGRGKLPGGNAMIWNWSQARDFGIKNPFILAGGLDPDNVACAIEQSFPDAVDVSSGVEISPGRKDIRKVRDFIKAVHSVSEKYGFHKKKPRKIFCS